jgi:3-oxoacyl-[acyl-carrier-protein] synthase II
MSRAPVITGLGVVSAFGVGVAALRDGLRSGVSGVGPITWFDASGFPVRVAGQVPGDALDGALARALPASLGAALTGGGALRDRKVIFALLAAAEAWRAAHAGPEEQGATLALAQGLEQAFLEDFSGLIGSSGAVDWALASSGQGVRLRSPVDLSARAVGRLLGLTGPSVSHVSACAAGGMALAQAAALIRRGAADVVVCGGTDSMVNPLGLGGMWRLGAPSPRASTDACRPFDLRRDGLVIGEGAAVFVVETEARARARGVRPLCRLLGAASTQDAFRVTAPRPDGESAARAISRALVSAGVSPTDVGYVNAHGTGTPLNDPAECRALRTALGAHAEGVAVSSIKGAVGHLMAAAGAIEAASVVLALDEGWLPGTANFAVRDPECDLDIIGPLPRSQQAHVALSNSFGFGGQNVTLVFGRAA